MSRRRPGTDCEAPAGRRLDLFVEDGRVGGRMLDGSHVPWEVRDLADRLGLHLYNDAVAEYLRQRGDACVFGTLVQDNVSVDEAVALGKSREPGALGVRYDPATRRCSVFYRKDGQDGQ